MNKKEKYDMKPIVATMDSALKKLTNKTPLTDFLNKWIKPFVPDKGDNWIECEGALWELRQHVKDECVKELINKIFIGVDRKHTVGWHSYLKIGNQTFYMTTCETLNEAEWFAEQLTLAVMSIAQE